MEETEAPGHSFILKAEELSMGIMDEEVEYGAICQDKLGESMESLSLLLMMNSEEGHRSESSFLNDYEIDGDLFISCDELCPGANLDNWSLDPLTNEPSHYNPTCTRATNFEEYGKGVLPNSSPLPLNKDLATQHALEDMLRSHPLSPSPEACICSPNPLNEEHATRPSPEDVLGLHLVSPSLEAGISSLLPLNKEPVIQHSPEDVHGLHALSLPLQVGIFDEKQLERENSKPKSSIDEESWSSKALHNGSKKRSLDWARKWPHLHSFLMKSSNYKSILPSKNGYESNKAGFNYACFKKSNSFLASDKKGRNFATCDRPYTSIDHHTSQSFQCSSKGVKKVELLKVSSSSEDDKPTTTSKGPSSKNLVSERKRQKLNENLYSVRALVPRIIKMNKASILEDAINYVRDLRMQVVDMEEGIDHLKGSKETLVNGLLDPTKECKQICHALNFHSIKRSRQRLHILKFHIMQIKDQLYQFCIHCKKDPGVFLQLTQALESLELKIINANLTSNNDEILNTLVIEVLDKKILQSEDIREKTLEAMEKFGLFMSYD